MRTFTQWAALYEDAGQADQWSLEKSVVFEALWAVIAQAAANGARNDEYAC